MEGPFHPIALKALKDCFKDISFDVYLQLSESKYVKAFDKETGLDFGRLTHYEAKGVHEFHIREADRERLDEFLVRSPMLTLTNPDAPFDMKKRAFWAVMEQSLFETFGRGQLSQVNVHKTFEALRSGLQTDSDFLSILSTLLVFCPKDDFFVKHAISTAVYSYVAAQVSGMSSERAMKILLFSSLFHDVGRLGLPENRRFRYQNKTPHEIAEFQRHPILTLNAMKSALPFADEEIRTCILHHRERLDGRGYPNMVKGPAIFPLARVIAIGDAFSELILGMEDGHFYSHAQAISVMRADEGRFDRKILTPFAQAVTQTKLSQAA